jgi:hypothetical protein
VHIAVKRGSSPEHSEWRSSMPPMRGAEPRQPHRTGHGAVPRRLRGLAKQNTACRCGRGRLEPCVPIGSEYADHPSSISQPRPERACRLTLRHSRETVSYERVLQTPVALAVVLPLPPDWPARVPRTSSLASET